MFLSTLLRRYTYSGLLLDGRRHSALDFFVALFCYPLYLYCNFSGFCDMVIAVSGLLGIIVMENFAAPFAARNLQDFWRRWHISLSSWLRDMLFTPIVKVMLRVFGPRHATHILVIATCVVFLMVGIWHGAQLHYILFGLSQGVGLAAVSYYSVWIKARLGSARFVKYRANRAIYSIAVVTTFIYFSVSLFLFANDWDSMKLIVQFVDW